MNGNSSMSKKRVSLLLELRGKGLRPCRGMAVWFHQDCITA